MLPPIKGFIENTLLDWEGRLAAVVFLPGCNFRCGYCHAAHLLKDDGIEAVPFEAVADCLARNKGWVDGVVITGGEPTLHNGLRDLILALRPLVGAVKLDTNGSRPGVLDALLQEGLVDYVAMDVKAPLDERYARVAGVQVALDDIRDSIETLIGGDVDYEFRTTVCPAQLTHPDILDTARAIRGARRYYLQPFRPANCLDPAFNGLAACGRDALRDAARQCVRYVQRCAVRGDAASEFVQTVP